MSDAVVLAQRLVRAALVDIELLARVDLRDPDALERLRGRLMGDLEAAAREASARHGAAVAAEIHYALVALADEVAQREPGPLRDAWKPRSLQLHYFRDNRAGHGFFERQDALLAAPPGGGREVALAVHALCLDLGLRGRHEHEDDGARALAQRRQALRAELRRRVAAAPLWAQAPRSGERGRPAPTLGALRWGSAALALFAASFFVQARCALGSMTEEVVARIQALLEAV